MAQPRDRQSSRRRRGGAAVGLFCALCIACSGAPPAPSAARVAPGPAGFVGSDACRPCHEGPARSWRGSHHDLAMQPATEDTVAGDFAGATFTQGGVRTRFFRGPEQESGRERTFMVRTDGPDGKLGDYRVAYTFGIAPLQQYLIERPGGRLQALGLCWDSRPREAGGQRWFHLYPDEAVAPGSPLHWTGPLQNWNSGCAECHSTHLQKNYDSDEDRYRTTWAEVDVACEACHGPGSRHVAWAHDATLADVPEPPGLGFDVRLARDPEAVWIFGEGSPTAHRTLPVTSSPEVEACGRCHARGSRITPDGVYGQPLEDTHRVALLDAGLYHADGQILDEVYVYGSFVQSKMYREGVTCTDCHDPHTARLRLEGNATCSPCHRAAAFDTPRHHFHAAGASCTGCHMPSRDYMVVDPRHDHGFHVPRPDLSVALGTPDPCMACHREQGSAWAAGAVADWYPEGRSGRPHPAEAMHAGRTWQIDGGTRLTALVTDPDVPAIQRATALSLLRRYPGAFGSDFLQGALRDADARVRRSATELLAVVEPAERLRLGTPLLHDPVRSVRLEAVRLLAEESGPTRSLALEAGLAEYRRAQEFHADRAEGQMNLAWLRLLDGDTERAERAYRDALRISPTFSPAAINLADLERLRGQDPLGERTLRAALVRTPDDADLHHALGLLLARERRYDAAIEALSRATSLARDTPRHAYVLALALNSTGRGAEALRTLERAHTTYPADADTLLALATISRDLGDGDAAKAWARRLLQVAPRNPEALQLLGERLEGLGR